MNKRLKIFSISLVTILFFNCKTKKESDTSIIFIDCNELNNNLGTSYGLMIKPDTIYSCIKFTTISKSEFKYSYFARETLDFDLFVDELTKLLEEYDQDLNKNIDDGSVYVLIIMNEKINKKYYLNSSLISDNLYEKIQLFKNYRLLDFKKTENFAFPTNEMCKDTIYEPDFIELNSNTK